MDEDYQPYSDLEIHKCVKSFDEMAVVNNLLQPKHPNKKNCVILYCKIL